MRGQQRSEIDQAEARLRRGIGYALLFGIAFWAAVVMLLVALGMAS